MTRRLPLLLLIAALPGLALAADQAPRGWSVVTWPNAALLAQQHSHDGYFDLRQTISCIPGDKTVSWRVYAPGGRARPEGARRGCDTRCRTELTATESDGPRPAGFTERQVAWSEARASIFADAPDQIAEFARACRLESGMQAAASPLQRDAGSAKTWTDPKLSWRILATGARQSVLPYDFAVSDQAWAYAAFSAPLATRRPAFVRLQARALKGRVGVALSRPDGSALVSGEQVLVVGETTTVYLRLKPGAPAAVLLRNYDAAGVAGAARLLDVAVVGAEALSAEELATVEASAK